MPHETHFCVTFDSGELMSIAFYGKRLTNSFRCLGNVPHRRICRNMKTNVDPLHTLNDVEADHRFSTECSGHGSNPHAGGSRSIPEKRSFPHRYRVVARSNTMVSVGKPLLGRFPLWFGDGISRYSSQSAVRGATNKPMTSKSQCSYRRRTFHRA